MSSDETAPQGPVAGWLMSQKQPVQCLISALLGSVASLGQAPYDQPIALILAMACAFAIWRLQSSASAAGWIGWAFGTGYFALALVWIVEPFQVDAGRHGWMAPFALLFLSAGLALFWGLAFRIARWLSPAAFGLVLMWTMAEVLRAYVLTGFPWASPAQVFVDGPGSRLLAWTGPHGATLCLILLAWLCSLPAHGVGRASVRLGQGALIFAASFSLYMPLARPDADRTGYLVRLVQPNAEQHLKWQPDMAEVFFERQLTFTRARGARAPDLIVWPETAIPWRLETAGPLIENISRAADRVPVVLGALRSGTSGVRNAAAVIDETGRVSQIYDKHHLVPFGEYIPLARLASRLGFEGLAANGLGFEPGPGPVLLDFGPMGRALPLICYEAVFAHGVGRAPDRADFLLQVTNDAWFGDYAGPQQHLAQARMRAIEQGLPLMRAANTGISAMIDPFGRVINQLPLGKAGFIDAELPQPLPKTLYSRTGDTPVVILLLLGLIAHVLRRGLRTRSN